MLLTIVLEPECLKCSNAAQQNLSTIGSYFLLSEEQRFTTCNKQGPIGPLMEDCEKVYKYYKTKVSIGHNDDQVDDTAPFGYSAGIQRWIAPTTGIYTYVVTIDIMLVKHIRIFCYFTAL